MAAALRKFRVLPSGMMVVWWCLAVVVLLRRPSTSDQRFPLESLAMDDAAILEIVRDSGWKDYWFAPS